MAKLADQLKTIEAKLDEAISEVGSRDLSAEDQAAIDRIDSKSTELANVVANEQPTDPVEPPVEGGGTVPHPEEPVPAPPPQPE